MKKLLYLIAAVALASCNNPKTTQTENELVMAPEFCEDSAYIYVADQCSFGPRVMNTAAHDSCGEYIANKFESFGATITNQYADSKLYDGTPIKMRNIIASVNPEAKSRILISGHWDSRPWADHDENEDMHHTPIDGANDGGSSVAVMLEMARILQKDLAEKGDSAILRMKGIGVDFICWDAEDCGTPEFAKGNDEDDEEEENTSNTWCLGSQYWAGTHHVSGYTALFGVNLDMVGGNNTVFFKEGYSKHFAPSIVDMIWKTGQKLGYDNYFIDDDGGTVTDDHVQVNLSGIPCVDILGSDVSRTSFPLTWHTVNDNIKNINKQTLKAVGQTMLTVLWNE